jgi:hypothetical protein
MTRLTLSCILLFAYPPAWAQASGAPALASPDPPAPSPPAAAPAGARIDISRALVERDAEPAMEIFRRGEVALGLAGLLQVQGAFYVGTQASIQSQDPADSEGFRIRRARFGLGGTLTKSLSFYLSVDLRDTVLAAVGGDQGSEILDAQIVWSPLEALQVSVGVDKVPLSSFVLRSAARLDIIEQPVSVTLLSPSRRVGVSVSGRVPTGRFGALRYAVGLYNGSEGITSGNRLAGLAGIGRVSYDLFEPAGLVPQKFGLTLGAAYMYDKGPSLAAHRVGGSLEIHGWRTSLSTELLYERSAPDERPTSVPNAGEATRWGFVSQLTVFLWKPYLQIAARYEYFSDNQDLPTLGRQQLLTGGLNCYLLGQNLKLQVNYIRRMELEGPDVANDIFFAQLQAMF